MFTFTVTSAGVPAGNYKATFEGVEPVQANAEKGYGAGIRFKWKVSEGPHAGQTASRVTGTSPTPGNACGKMIAAVVGRPLAVGESLNLQSYVGKPYLIVVAAGQQGGTRVDSAIAIG